MSQQESLYREIILDHYRSPRQAKLLDSPTCSYVVHNPLCGDRATVTLQITGGAVQDVGIEVSGCALSVAGGSVVAELILGGSVEAACRVAPETVLAALGNIQPSSSRQRCVFLVLDSLYRHLDPKAVAAFEKVAGQQGETND